MSLRLSTAPHIRSPKTTTRLMLNVLLALLPSAAAGVWYFGTRALMLLCVSTASAVVAEYLWQKLGRLPVRVGDLSAAVTGLILGLILPPTATWWMAVVGSVFAIIIVKQLFGGIGDNFLNPAMAARAVLLASWPARMTAYVTGEPGSAWTRCRPPRRWHAARRAHIPIWSCFWEMCRARSAKPASSRFWRDCFFCF